MTSWTVAVTFSVGDPETVARITIPGVEAVRPTAAAQRAILSAVGDGSGFTYDDVVEVVVTRTDPGVARNLLATYDQARNLFPTGPDKDSPS